MTELMPREFARNRVLLSLMAVNAVLFGLVGILFIISGKFLLTFVWWAGAALWGLNFFWSRNTPYIRLTTDECQIFPAMARPPRLFRWETILEMRQDRKNKIHLSLAHGKALKVSLFSIQKDQRDALKPALAAAIENQGPAQAQ